MFQNTKKSTNSNKELYLFVHIPKTAGTSFRKALEKQFGSSRIIYDYGARSPVTSQIIQSSIYRKSINGSSLQEYIDENSVKVIGGHINHRQIEKYCFILGKRLKLITFLREPIRRCLSDYFHHIYHYGYSGSIEEFISKTNKSNLQSRTLTGIDFESFYFLGITEKYNQLVDFLIIFLKILFQNSLLTRIKKLKNLYNNCLKKLGILLLKLILSI